MEGRDDYEELCKMLDVEPYGFMSKQPMWNVYELLILVLKEQL